MYCLCYAIAAHRGELWSPVSIELGLPGHEISLRGIQKDQREISIQLSLQVLVLHQVPRCKRYQTHKCDQHANVEAYVDFEASMVVFGLTWLQMQAQI